ncbi:Histidine kinase [Rhodovastum atsumiense]|uniref:histidine kinase n=1 Tax=Rhodovastum atsumiense TaxID=504468 RepID=A0A5M6IRA8_9PROT|nr:ATP-binding protein [Rhodovastum atsumiense]KAA5610822.1 response regulator [Rhodovastum atsumiense]CAH2602132.1 Histidine kinase [Rhodovastum atsumiense]
MSGIGRVLAAPRRLAAWIGLQWLWAAAAIALVWGVAAVHLVEERADTLRGAEMDSASRAHAYAEALLRTVRELDQTALLIRALDERGGPEPDLAGWLAAVDPVQRVPVQITLVARDGMVRLSNLQKTTQRVDLSDRPHFRRFADRPEDVLHVSPPVFGRLSKLWTIQFVRMLRGPEGSFNGIVVVSAEPAALVRFVSAEDIGVRGTMSLIGLDGVIRARIAAGAEGVITGQPSASPAVQEAVAREAGHFTWTDPQDGVRRIESFRRLPGLPLLVSVGLDEMDVLAEYRADLWRMLPVCAVVTLVVLAIAAVAARHRRRREEAQRVLNLAMENISQGLLMVNPDGRIAVMNRRLVELLGLPPEIQPGMPVEEMMDRQRAAGEYTTKVEPPEAAATLGRMASFTDGPALYKRTRPTGTVLEVRTKLLPDGAAVRSFSDVTAWEQAQDALRAARTAAEAGIEARTRFLAVMSHEIRTPLNGILGAAELLQDTELTPRQQHCVQTVRHCGRHLLGLVSDILDFSKIDQNAIELETAPFAPAGVLAAMQMMMAPLAAEKGLWLRVEADAAVPAQVCGDAHRLRQVLLNLVGNAVKFTGAGGITVRLDAAPAATGWRLDWRVRDTGIGIPAEAQENLFQEFAQADGSITRRFGGTGLGLAISRRLVQAMGGDIVVFSRDGEGSEFRFHVIVATAGAAAGPPAALRSPGCLRVLLAEDNPVNRMIATGLLEKLGHRVEAVEDGAAAVAAVRRGGVDLVFMDVMMPVMDGLTATRAIRALEGPAGRIPVIGLTANAFREDEANCRAAGMDGFAPKPITRERLARELDRVCGAAIAAGTDPPAAPAPAATGAIDVAVLDALAATLGEDTVAEVVTVFLADVPDRLARLRDLAEAGTTEALAREAHALAGSAGTLGLRALEATARELERALKTSDHPDALGRVAEIGALAEQAVTALAPVPGRMACGDAGIVAAG